MQHPHAIKGIRREGGFTLVELLVVIAIIAVVVGISMPAITGAIESGRRNTCMTNQARIVLAISQYEDAKQAIPGWRNPDPLFADNRKPCWPVVILPFMDQQPFYDMQVKGGGAEKNIAAFICPSSDVSGQDVGGYLSYAGNVGIGHTIAGNSAIWALPTSSAWRYLGVMTDAISWRPVTFSDVSKGDGLTYTLLLADKCKPTTQGRWNYSYNRFGSNATDLQWGLGGLTSAGKAEGVQSSGFGAYALWQQGFVAPAMPIINPTDPLRAAYLPSSNHPRGAVVAFCDGSTKLLAESTPASLYFQLLSWNQRLLKNVASEGLNGDDFGAAGRSNPGPNPKDPTKTIDLFIWKSDEFPEVTDKSFR